MRVFGVDGTLINLPNVKELIKKFGVWGGSKGNSSPRARVSTLYDCLNHVSYDAQIEPKKIGERVLAARHIQNTSIEPTDVITLDRGYAAVWLFLLIMQSGGHFCARMPTSWKKVREFKNDPERWDEIVEFEADYKGRKECKKYGIEIKPLKMRLVKIVLDGGGIEILATSLIDDKYGADFFKELYNLRWQTEENYKVIKCRIRIEKFVGQTEIAIRQEFHARIFMLNVTSVIRIEADHCLKQKEKERRRKNKTKTKLKVNFKAALSKMRNTGVLLFFSSVSTVLESLISKIIEDVTRIVPNRKYGRKQNNMKGCHQPYSSI